MVKKSNQQILEYNELYEENELFSKCGQLQKVLGPAKLSGEYSEYQVVYNKLFFSGRVIIFEVKITNTLADTVNLAFSHDFLDDQKRDCGAEV